jgi:hypothetical protein
VAIKLKEKTAIATFSKEPDWLPEACFAAHWFLVNVRLDYKILSLGVNFGGLIFVVNSIIL